MPDGSERMGRQTCLKWPILSVYKGFHGIQRYSTDRLILLILQIKGYSLVTITWIGYFRGNLGLLSRFGSPLARLVVVQPQGGGRSQ